MNQIQYFSISNFYFIYNLVYFIQFYVHIKNMYYFYIILFILILNYRNYHTINFLHNFLLFH